MRIAYIVPSLRNRGPIIVVKELTDFLVDCGIDITVFYFDEFSSVMHFKCLTKHISMNYAIDFDQYDIVHSHCLRPNMYVVRWKNRIHKAKTISTIHQNAYVNFKYKYNVILSSILAKYFHYLQSKFDGVVCISNQIKSAYEGKLKNSVVTIYNGCAIDINGDLDQKILNSIFVLRGKYKILGTYAVISRLKGLNQVVSALKYLPDYAFVVIGDGPDVKLLKQMAAALQVEERVVFFSYQKNPTIYLPYFDVYMMPSYSEGFGLSMVEAALAGKAIVCSNIPSFREIFSDEEATFFELDDMKSLVEAIKKAYDKKDAYGLSAKLKAQSEFSAQKMAERYLEYYKNILSI